MSPRTLRTLEPLVYVAVILALLALIQHMRHSALSDFDFSTGTVRCGVAGLSTSCGSVGHE